MTPKKGYCILLIEKVQNDLINGAYVVRILKYIDVALLQMAKVVESVVWWINI